MLKKIIKSLQGVTLIFLICGSLANAEMVPNWSFVTIAPFNLIEPSNIVNPVISASDIGDVNAEFVADPFLFFENHTWYMFFEVYDHDAAKGEIGLAKSSDGFHWAYQQIVLDEPFHLSYPHVFKWKGEYYLMPESYEANSIRLYKAVQFPFKWALAGIVLNNVTYVDSDLFYYSGKLWLFTSERNNAYLHVFYADDLTGPWTEHPESPVVVNNASIARPGGRSFVFNNNRVIRVAQQCDTIYGQRVRAFEIDTLTPSHYAEHEIPESPILKESGAGWNASGMHQFDPWWTGNYWLAAVDGHIDYTFSIGIYVNDSDLDGDGTQDYLDGCINDPYKTQPGQCGCGIADTDSDGDGIDDCIDTCNDLIDTDGDGTDDCIDLCPNDPNKTQPGQCGCGLLDTDSDGDGIADCNDTNYNSNGLPVVEEQGPEGDNPDYDGNYDGIADDMEVNVASFHTYDHQAYVTLESPVGTSINSCQAHGNPSLTDAPSDIEFSYGFFEFTVGGVGKNAATKITLHLPAGETVDTYYKYGPTPDNPADHWYEFLYDGQTGAEINGNIISLHFVDGLRGDDDLSANGIVVDVGGPAVEVNPAAGTSGGSGGGGGGGCFIAAAING